MIAEFIFTPSEAKCLIAKAVAQLPRVREAMGNGILAMHPSSSTYFIFKELTGAAPTGQVWVTGIIVPKGLCVEAHTQVTKKDEKEGVGLGKALFDPGLYPHSYTIIKGQVVYGQTIYDLIDKMGPGDIYLKGVNAIDTNGKVGVLLGSMAEGTIGKMVAARRDKGFEIMCPVGLEKLIPGSIDEASAFVERKKDYSMGQKCRLKGLDSTVVTELDAVKMLAEVEAVMFAAGGIGQGEGTVCLAVEGAKAEVEKIIAIAEACKGAQLPQVETPQCMDCSHPSCHQKGMLKRWVQE